MFRKTIFALAGTAAIGAAALAPTAASAGGGGGYHGHWHGGFGFGGFGVTVVNPVVASSCWQERWVQTRSGYLKRIVVNVCDY
jgi:hypothetical protein